MCPILLNFKTPVTEFSIYAGRTGTH